MNTHPAPRHPRHPSNHAALAATLRIFSLVCGLSLIALCGITGCGEDTSSQPQTSDAPADSDSDSDQGKEDDIRHDEDAGVNSNNDDAHDAQAVEDVAADRDADAQDASAPHDASMMTDSSSPDVPDPSNDADMTTDTGPLPEDEQEVEPSTLQIVADDPCVNPCRFRVAASRDIARVSYDADGWNLGDGVGLEFSLTYRFNTLGRRTITASAYNADQTLVAVDARVIEVLDDDTPQCLTYTSDAEDFAPLQRTGVGLPPGADAQPWRSPTTWTWWAEFVGQPGELAGHEGRDYVHDDTAQQRVPVESVGDGTVVYVRLGCPQSAAFTRNLDARECGSGWGNHVVIDHGEGLMTRYAHMAPDSIALRVGQQVLAGDFVGDMGNTGRSEVRHLHFEVGRRTTPFDPCAASQSFDAVYSPALIGL